MGQAHITVLLCVAMGGTGIMLIVMAVRARDGRLRRNPWAGMRTPTTRSSDRAWLAAHRASYSWTVAGGVVSLVAAALLPFAGSPQAAAILALVASVVLLALVVVGGVLAQRAAREVARQLDA